MRRFDYRGKPRTVAIFGHTVHLMLLVFSIGFLAGALATDLASLVSLGP